MIEKQKIMVEKLRGFFAKENPMKTTKLLKLLGRPNGSSAVLLAALPTDFPIYEDDGEVGILW